MSDRIVKHVPSIPEVIADPSVRFRLKKWIQEAIDADPVDAYHDAVLLVALLEVRLQDKPGRWS
jgi:hypothetical protein